jgi:Metallo-peptidase family M12
MSGTSAYLRIFAVLVALLVVSCRNGNAQKITPYRAMVALEGIYNPSLRERSTTELERIPTVRVRGRIYAAGNIDLHLTTKRNKTWRSFIRRNGREEEDLLQPVLLRGSVAIGGGLTRSGRRIMPTAASIIGSKLKLTFPGRAKGSRGTLQRIYTITMTIDGAILVSARISSIPSSARRRGACGASTDSMNTQEHDAPIVQPIKSEEENGVAELSKVVTISTDADQEWYAKYGDSSNAVIASIINAAEAIYARQLGIRFRVVRQHVYSESSPYNTTEPIRLLNAFTGNVENPYNLSETPAMFHQEVDIKHLFTGKNFDGSVIGIAYIGVVCSVPTLSYGITQSYVESADSGIFAHELGHNFGANHDTSTRGSLMYPSISIPPSDHFSEASLQEINQHITQSGSCISIEQVVPRPDITPGVPTPTPPEHPDLNTAKLTITKSRVGDANAPVVRMLGQLVSNTGVPISAVGIRLFAAGEPVGDAVSDEQGNFKFFVRLTLPKDKKIYMYAETLGGEIYSNFLWLGKTSPKLKSSGRRRS